MVDLSTDPDFFTLLNQSHARRLGTPLVPDGRDAEWLYGKAPFAVLAHGPGPDPKFIYANQTAQTCFEYHLEELLALPSRLSAEPADQAERQTLLDEVARHGFLSGYRGVRIAKSGRRFVIENGIVWELVDRDGLRHGQAATFRSWRNI